MAKRINEKQWTELLAKFEGWQGSPAELCRKHRLSYQTLRAWRRSAMKSASGSSPRFVEVEILGGARGAGEEDGRPVAELDVGSQKCENDVMKEAPGCVGP